MGLVVISYDFIFFGIVGVAFVGAMYAIWSREGDRKCNELEISMYDSLVATKCDSDNALVVGVTIASSQGIRRICISSMSLVSFAILSSFLAWNLLNYGRSIYNPTDLGDYGHAQPQVPCYFVFGDSLVDNGNNNLLRTRARANYLPYGIDYPLGPTGRFSNGKNLADFIAQYLGFSNPIQPYVSIFSKTRAILRGVNYGSGAAGIRNESGEQLGDRFSMDEQLNNHRTIVSRIGSYKGSSAKDYLKTCIYSVGMGANDYINNYLMPGSFNTSSQFTPFEYAAALLEQYTGQLRTLYSYGARKIAVFGIGFIGCTPFAINGTNACSDTANFFSQIFDTQLPRMVDTLNNDLTDAQFIYINVSQISLTPIPNSGITVQDQPCCVVSARIADGQCDPFRQITCRNRTTHLFFDGFHPAEYATKLEADRAYIALTPLDAYPFDIRTLAQL